MEQFFAKENTSITIYMTFLNIGLYCNQENSNKTLKDSSTLTLKEKYCAFEERVRKGHLGKTAVFWMSYIVIFYSYSFSQSKTNMLIFSYSTDVIQRWKHSSLHVMTKSTPGFYTSHI